MQYMKKKFKYKSERLKILTIENIDNILNKYAERGYELESIHGDIFIFKYRLETRGRKKSQ